MTPATAIEREATLPALTTQRRPLRMRVHHLLQRKLAVIGAAIILLEVVAATPAHGAFGPTERYQSRICSPVKKATSGRTWIASKMRRKYLVRCGAPMM